MAVYDREFEWPPQYDPKRAAVRCRTSRDIDASAAAVWAALIDPQTWPSYFALSRDVTLPDGGRTLSLGVRFRWTMQGIRFESDVREFVPKKRLSWRSYNALISTYHIWDLDESDGKTNVTTDETQLGLLPRLFGSIVRPKLANGQRVWLEALSERAQSDSVRLSAPLHDNYSS